MKKIIWVLLILIVLCGGYYFFKSKTNNTNYNNVDQNNLSTTNTATASTTITASSTKTYTLTEVSTHSSNSSCWSVISGKVYDLTSWIGKHPGGSQAILAICGTDGTQAFDGKHGMDPRAKGVLPNFYLGDLAN